ncbi:MAG: hypothetical protein D6704_12410 [Nitrospirae bacterium]|nr:MAG: hypothetical protein D6704_12410 [Nitrospirota bacterium]
MSSRILSQTYLQSDSPAYAWYQLRLLRLAEGFAVEKTSGCRGRKPNTEAWFRWEETAARKLYDKILHTKTSGNRQRRYKQSQEEIQLSLF